jgi:anion-transporting  ArsA/GET3 family ATPase
VLHFVTGKGGVGKSTFAALKLRELLEKDGGPVLLLEVQGSGYVLRSLGLEPPTKANAPLPLLPGAFGALIYPRETFQQYFNILLSLGNEQSTFGQSWSSIREKIVEKIMENRAISAFVDACPGLEPAVLLGKLHWEAAIGKDPLEHKRWKHVIVDAPSTGHGLMFFESLAGIGKVFGSGIIHRQVESIFQFLRNPQETQIYLVGTPEELPLEEIRVLSRELQRMELPVSEVVLNRTPPEIPNILPESTRIAEPWRSELLLEWQTLKKKNELMMAFEHEFSHLPHSPDSGALPMKSKVPACDLCLVLGAGGVGKTTTSASLALQMAKDGKRVALITVDPAKRLAQVLGLETLSCIPVEVYRDDSGGTCHALSLDPESFLKDFLNRYTQNSEAVTKIINNRMFQIVRTQLGGIEEYLGIEKIVSLARSGNYDVCVLDTPPSRHAIDFLEAPAHVLRFFDERILKFFIQEEVEKSQRGVSGFLKKVLSLNRAVDLFKSFLGPGFLNELSDLLLAVKPIYEIFVDTSETIHEWVRSQHVKFICVSVLEKTPMQEVRNLCHELSEHNLPEPSLFILNKNTP